MNPKHLLWWVFKHLAEKHPAVLTELLNIEGEFGGNATHSVKQQMQEAFARYEQSLKDKAA